MEKIQVVFEPRDRIVSMVEHRGEVYVATERHVYRMQKDALTDSVRFLPVVFHQEIVTAPASTSTNAQPARPAPG